MTKPELFNIKSKTDLQEKLRNEPFERITCSFYRYVEISSPESMRDALYLEWKDLNILGREIGGFPPDLLNHFLESFANSMRANFHIKSISGVNDHHKAEACFKAFAKALDSATTYDDRRAGIVPSTKGSLD